MSPVASVWADVSRVLTRKERRNLSLPDEETLRLVVGGDDPAQYAPRNSLAVGEMHAGGL